MEPSFYQSRKPPPPSAMPSLFDPPPAPASEGGRIAPLSPIPEATPPVGVIPQTASTRAQRRRAKVDAQHHANDRRWIDAGKPIVLAVLKANGRVTAETWRAAAAHVPRALPPITEERTLSYVSTMFAELVREGVIQKKRRADGSVVKELSSEHRNEHTVYVAVERV